MSKADFWVEKLDGMRLTFLYRITIVTIGQLWGLLSQIFSLLIYLFYFALCLYCCGLRQQNKPYLFTNQIRSNECILSSSSFSIALADRNKYLSIWTKICVRVFISEWYAQIYYKYLTFYFKWIDRYMVSFSSAQKIYQMQL